jgi:hypothetical protein
MGVYEPTLTSLGDTMRGLHTVSPFAVKAHSVAARLPGTCSENSRRRRVLRPIWTASQVDSSYRAERRAPNRLRTTPTSLSGLEYERSALQKAGGTALSRTD